MGRRPRGDQPGAWHHVVNRAIAKRPYFETRADQRYFLARLAIEARAGRVEVHAYSLLTSHFHLLVRSPRGELSEAMRRVQFAYSRRFNRLRRRDGPLIRGRFYSKRVDNDLYRRAVVRYIDANVVSAGIVPVSADHEFGSARTYLGRRRPPWLSTWWAEQRAREILGAPVFSVEAYLAAFGPRESEDLTALCELIDARLASARTLDPLEDLIGSSPRQVEAWMRRKAMLADGMEVGLPVCSVHGLRRAIAAEVTARGDWIASRRDRAWRGSDLAWVGLLKGLCAQSWARVAALSKRSVAGARRDVAVHGELGRTDTVHAERVVRIGSDAVKSSLPLFG